MTIALKRGLWFTATVIYMSGILWCSTWPGSDKQSGHYSVAVENFKNFLHFPAYGGLAWLWIKTFNSVGFRALALSFLIAVSWGVLNEFVQSHTPNRYFSVEDMMVNALGAGLTLALARKGIIANVE